MRRALRRAIATSLIALIGPGIVGPVAPTPRASAADRQMTVSRLTPGDPAIPETLRPSTSSFSTLVRPDLGKLPLHFEENVGQSRSDIRYSAQVGSLQLLMTDSGPVLDLRAPDLSPKATNDPARRHTTIARRVSRLMTAAHHPRKGVVRMEFVGATVTPPVAEQKQPGVVNYFMGRDPRYWRTNVATFARVRYPNAYPGIDVVFYGNGRQYEYDFVLAPGADPRKIRVAFRGIEKQEVTASGDLLLSVDGRTLRQHKPSVYQDVAGERRAVPGRYVVASNGEIGFEVGRYVASLPLVIDPSGDPPSAIDLGHGDEGYSFAAVGDPSGNSYVTGITFTIPGNDVATSAFILKLDPSNNIVWKALLGGLVGGAADGSASEGYAITLDAASANVFVTGSTDSANFAVTDAAGTVAAAQRTYGEDACLSPVVSLFGSPGDAFVAKLTSAGALAYATYLGGNLFDFGYAITVDAAGAAYVTGGWSSTPVTELTVDQYNSLTPACQAAVGTTFNGNGNYDLTAYSNTHSWFSTPAGTSLDPLPATTSGLTDIFTAKVSQSGNILTLNFLTIQGGPREDTGVGIVVNGSGEIVVTGETPSLEVPQTASVAPSLGAELASLDRATNSPLADVEAGFMQATCYLVAFRGATFTDHSTGFVNPLGPGIKAGVSCTDSGNGVLTKLTTAGKPATTYLVGGSGDYEQPAGVAVDASGNVYIAGATFSRDFPQKSAITKGGNPDPLAAAMDGTAGSLPNGRAAGFVMKLTLPAAGQAATTMTQTNIGYSSGLGGSDGDTTPTGIAVAPTGDVFVSGVTTATDNQVVPPAQMDTTTGNAVPTAYLLQIPAPSSANVAPTVTDANQIMLGATDGGIQPTGNPISTDADGNVIIAGAAAQSSATAGFKFAITIPTSIDIRPDDKNNNINLNEPHVDVALLSTKQYSWPDRIDPPTLKFGLTGTESTFLPKYGCKTQGRKVNKDEFKDLVCRFAVPGTGFVAPLVSTDPQQFGVLTGNTKSGAIVTGTDFVAIKPLCDKTLAGCNLSGLNLVGRTFAGRNVSGANFSKAILTGDDFTGANLTGATLSGATLTNAKLIGATIKAANLSSANLTGANLTNANFTGVNLAGANLTSATLTGVVWSLTVCPDGTLSNLHGNTCVGHLQPIVVSKGSDDDDDKGKGH